MRTLVAPTEQFIKGETTRLTADVAAGSNVSLPVENSDGFADTTFVVVGYAGNELAEMEQVNAAVSSATSMRVATLKFNHQKGEPVTVYRYNKRKFYGATLPAGPYVELTGDGSPKDIQVDDPQGTVLEYSDSLFEYFKATYYNSETDEETSIDDASAEAGDQTGRYTTLYAIRKHAGLAGNPRYSDVRIEVKRKQAENEVNSAIASRYRLPLTEVPALLGYVTELLAAGYIDLEEFGSEGEGVKWLGEARGILKSLTKGTQLLLAADGTELTRVSGTGTITGNPSSSSPGDAQFTMDQKF